MVKYFYYIILSNGAITGRIIKGIGSFPISTVLQYFAEQEINVVVLNYFEISQEEAEKLYEYRESNKGTKSK